VPDSDLEADDLARPSSVDIRGINGIVYLVDGRDPSFKGDGLDAQPLPPASASRPQGRAAS
jgi:hypothetical protein